MPERLSPRPKPACRRVPSRCRIRPPVVVRRAAKSRQSHQILSRSASEPILWTVQFLPCDSLTSTDDKQALLLRPQTFMDGGFFSSWSSSSHSLLPSPSPPRPNFIEAAKVVVSVTVEGSPGPVRTMMKLGASVDEAIGVVVERYKREGRSPRLDCGGADSFELHHSHFSLQSLNKSDKIGELGSRNFYLRKSCGTNSFNSATDERTSIGSSEVELLDGRIQAAPPPPPALLFFSFIARRLSKIRRRGQKLWRVVTCITCV